MILCRAKHLSHSAIYLTLPSATSVSLHTSGCARTGPQRFAHLVRRGADLIGIGPPKAARPLYGVNPATPFAAAVATKCAVIDH